MSRSRFDEHLGVPHFLDLARKQRAKFFSHLGRDPPGAPVGDDSIGIERAEIGARGDVARLEVHSQAQRFDHPASDLVLDGIIPEQSQVPRPAAGSDSRRHRYHAPLRSLFGETVEIGGVGGFQRRQEALLLGGDVAQAIQDDQCQLGVRFNRQFRIKLIKAHIKKGQVPSPNHARPSPSRQAARNSPNPRLNRNHAVGLGSAGSPQSPRASVCPIICSLLQPIICSNLLARPRSSRWNAFLAFETSSTYERTWASAGEAPILGEVRQGGAAEPSPAESARQEPGPSDLR